MSRDAWRLYPMLLSAWPVLALAAQNTQQLHSPRELMAPVLLAVLVALLGWGAASLVTPHPTHRALIAAATGLWWSFFSEIHDAILRLPIPGLGEPWAALLALLALAGFAIIVVRRVPPSWDRANQVALVTAVVLILLAVAPLVRDSPYPHLAYLENRPRPAVTESSETAGRPDVYLIILDSYAGRRSLAADHGVDNAPFEEALRSRGFFVPQAPRANYLRTYFALASMLNWRYVQDMPGFSGPRPITDPEALYTSIAYNRTVERFLAEGYRFVFFPTATSFTLTHPWADVQPTLPDPVRGAFTVYWPGMTPLPLLEVLWCRLRPCARAPRAALTPETAARFDAKLQAIPWQDTDGRPTLVFMHLMLPHEPYLYAASCGHLASPVATDVETVRGDSTIRAAYAAQVRCLNQQLLAMIDRILSQSAVRPIIILQADHGQRYDLSHSLRLSAVSRDQLDGWFDIFAAYLAPPERLSRLSETVTPVNAMRVLLGDSAGRALEPVPDLSYWSTRTRPFAWEEIRWPRPADGARPED